MSRKEFVSMFIVGIYPAFGLPDTPQTETNSRNASIPWWGHMVGGTNCSLWNQGRRTWTQRNSDHVEVDDFCVPPAKLYSFHFDTVKTVTWPAPTSSVTSQHPLLKFGASCVSLSSFPCPRMSMFHETLWGTETAEPGIISFCYNIDEMPLELNPYLHQLAYFIIHYFTWSCRT